MKKMKLLLALGIIAAVTIATLGACASSEQKPTVPVIQNDLKSLKVGNITTLGTYPKYEEDDKMPIEWRVLAVEDGKVLLISESIIDTVAYHNTWEPVTWENCTLRAWLNEDFYNSAFDQSEQMIIVETKLANPNNPIYESEGGNETIDKIFLLSMDEAVKYFNMEKASGEDAEFDYASSATASGKPTWYALSKGAWKMEMKELALDGTGCWWLRSPGYDNHFATYIYFDGAILGYGYGVHSETIAVRPAMWISP